MGDAAEARYPFLFLGQGLAESQKCLEGYLWFQRAPTPEEQPRITAALPAPVQCVCRFEDTLLHWGSDDLFPQRVKALYDPAFAKLSRDEAHAALERAWEEDLEASAPSEQDWVAFCDAFERATHAIHDICPLRAVLKPDDDRGPTLGAWHRWSVAQAASVIAVAPPEPVTRSWSFFAANLLQDVLTPAQIAKMPLDARVAWLRWLSVIAPRAAEHVVFGNSSLVGGPPISSLASELLDAIAALLAGAPEAEAARLREAIGEDAQRLLAQHEAWERGTTLLRKGTAREIAEAIERRLLSVERAVGALTVKPNARSRRRQSPQNPQLEDVLPSSPTLSMLRSAATGEIREALIAERLTIRDLRTCAMCWPEIAEPLLRVLVSTVPLPDAASRRDRDAFFGAVHALAVSLERKGAFDAAWEAVAPYVSYAREAPYLCHAAACALVQRGCHDEAIAQIRAAVESGYAQMAKLRTDPHLAPLLGDARFRALVDLRGADSEDPDSD